MRVRDAVLYARLPLRRRPRPPGRLVRIDGEAMHFLDVGSGPPVLLVHGLLGNTFMWRHIVPVLAKQHRVIAVDLVGFGHSGRRYTSPLSLAGHARRLGTLLRRLEIERATVVGHSMGGAIAQRIALEFPDLVERLVLIAALNAEQSPVWGRDARRVHSAARHGPLIRRAPLVVRMLTGAALRRMAVTPTGVTRASVLAYSDPLLRPRTLEAFLALFHEVADEAGVDISGIDVPALIISGGLDRSVLPATGEAIAMRIRDSRHLVIDDAGHLCIEEHHEVVAQHLLEFLSSGE